MSAEGTMKEACGHPFNSLPGDPSLHLVTNVDLGDKKMDIMKACSKVICKATGKVSSLRSQSQVFFKACINLLNLYFIIFIVYIHPTQPQPESYIAISLNDKQDVIFGGSDAPTALGTLYSIGAIGKESNGKITSDITDLLEPFGVAENRIYINFFDMPRANVGWSRRTFAG